MEELKANEEYTLASFRAAVPKTNVRQWKANVQRTQTRMDALEEEYRAKSQLLQQEMSDTLAPVYEECVRGINKDFRAAFYKEYYSDNMKPAYIRVNGEHGSNRYDILQFDGKRYLYQENTYLNEGSVVFAE